MFFISESSHYLLIIKQRRHVHEHRKIYYSNDMQETSSPGKKMLLLVNLEMNKCTSTSKEKNTCYTELNTEKSAFTDKI